MNGFVPTWSPRPLWRNAPTAIRDWAADLLGGPPVSAIDCHGGFSAGFAARLTGPTGRRLFVKAVSTVLNPRAPDLYRAEAHVAYQLAKTARLSSLPAPALRGDFDDGEWVALAFDDVVGTPARWPWNPDQLQQTLDGLAALHETLTPAVDLDLPSAADELAHDLQGWARALGEPSTLDALSPWLGENAFALAQRCAGLDLSGSTVLHLDIRADNVLIDDSGRAWFVDWPWACVGPPALDVVILLINAALAGLDPERWLARSSAAPADPEFVTGAIAAVAGIWVGSVSRPSPPGTSGLREFQLAHLDAATRWLQRRLPA